MIPTLRGFDHIHVYVANRDEAADWYGSVMGLKPVEKFSLWATKEGPLTLQDAGHNVHLALFERPKLTGTSAIAFAASGPEFLAWKNHLENHSLKLRVSDHQIMYSLYFKDPDENLHEITTGDYDYVKKELAN